QIAACAILPPSRGKAGNRLNTSTSALIVATQLSHTSAGDACTPPVASAASKKWLLSVASWPATVQTTIKARATRGPATATRRQPAPPEQRGGRGQAGGGERGFEEVAAVGRELAGDRADDDHGQRHEGSGDRYAELGARTLRLAGSRHAPQRPQVDARHRQASAARDERVTELVQDQRGEERQHGCDSH